MRGVVPFWRLQRGCHRQAAWVGATVCVGLLAAFGACKKQEEERPPAQGGYDYGPGYGQQQPPLPGGQTAPPAGYGQQPGYAAQPAPTAPPQLSEPGLGAFPCQTDAVCLSHRCNTSFGKCAFPCQSNNDCQPGFQCLAPACVPILGQPTQ